MMMRKLLLIFFVSQVAFLSQGQETDTIFIQLYGVAGGYGETPQGASLSYSMGESMVSTAENFGQTLTQGFQQNSFEAAVGIIEIEDPTISVEAFPNPTTEFLNIRIIGTTAVLQLSDYELMVYDMLGKEISIPRELIDNQTIQLDLKGLPTGIYVTKIMSLQHKKSVSTFKITKTEMK